jgi:hypothetical protein
VRRGGLLRPKANNTTITTSISLPPEERELLERLAVANGTSLSQVWREALRVYASQVDLPEFDTSGVARAAAAERARAEARKAASKAPGRPERKRRWDRENRRTCACGKPMARKSETCGDCRKAATQERWDTIRRLRGEGLFNFQIAQQLGVSTSCVASAVVEMRNRGIHVAATRHGRPVVAGRPTDAGGPPA